MLTKVLIVFVLIAFLSVVGYFYTQSRRPLEPSAPIVLASPSPSASPGLGELRIPPFDFANASFKIDDTIYNFKNGLYPETITEIGSPSATIGTEAISPSRNRAAAIIMDNPGGSGTFNYIVGGMLIDEKIIYSQPVLVGDRVQFQKLTAEDPGDENNGIVTFEYLDRNPDEPMSAAPTQQVTKKYAFEENGNLIEVLN